MANVTRKFSVEELEEDYDLPWGAVSDEVADKHRWYTIHELVFKADDGHHYEVNYMDPATEMQEGQDRWFDDPMTAVKVVEKEVVTKVWVPADE